MDDQRQQQIERYLDGQLPDGERASFEASLANDPALAEAVELERAARAVVKAAGREKLRQRLDGFERAWEKERPKVRTIPFVRRRLLAVAAVLLAMAAAAIWLFQKPAHTPTELFAEHFTVYRPPATERAATPAPTGAWQQASARYAQGDFATAATGFQAALQDSSTIAYLAHFYRGVSLLAQPRPDPEKAITAFDEVLKLDTDFRQQAMWYRGLALLQAGRWPEAKSVFEEIVEKGFFQKKEAKKILEASVDNF